MVNTNGNLMTEEVAARRWCPFTRMQQGPVSGINRKNNGEFLPGSNCQGSKCMAWRWDHASDEAVGSCGLAGAVGSVVVPTTKR